MRVCLQRSDIMLMVKKNCVTFNYPLNSGRMIEADLRYMFIRLNVPISILTH